MADYTYEEIKNKTVAQLREIASGIEHEAVVGYSTFHKEELVHAVCTALGLEEMVHHHVVGIDKSSIKVQIKALKAEREAALEAHDSKQLKIIRRKIHRLKRAIHRATV